MPKESVYTVQAARTDKQLEAIADLHMELFNGGARSVPDLQSGHWWLVHHAGQSVAFAGLDSVTSGGRDHAAYLCRSGVLWDHQGNGLQKRLIRLRMTKARQLGWEWIISDTLANNYASANSLISCGFKLFKPPRKWGERGSLYWRRPL